VIQAVSLLKNGDEYDVYVLLQIPQGCDVRGGYTKPRFFHIIDRDSFLMAMTDLNASCECGSVYSDDSGYHWYDGNGHLITEKYTLPKRWVPRRKFEDVNGKRKYKTKSYEYELRCRKCGKTVEFWANLDY